MRATGIVRRIDDLGRIVIPKEIRKVLKIREGEALEIFTARDNEIIFKKYSPMGELETLAQDYVEVLSEQLNYAIIVTDRDSVIATSNTLKKIYKNKDISSELEKLIEYRDEINAQDKTMIPLIENDSTDYKDQIITPLISSKGDCIGAIALISTTASTLSKQDEKILKIAADFLGKQA